LILGSQHEVNHRRCRPAIDNRPADNSKIAGTVAVADLT
jgi:hypothetical protein